MIKIDNDFSIGVNSTNGFELHHLTQKIREADGKKFKKGDKYAYKEVYFYPKLSQVLDKYFLLSLKRAEDIKKLKETVKNIESNISKFEKIYYVNKKLIEL